MLGRRGMVEVNRRFKVACCFRHQGDRFDYETTWLNNPEDSRLHVHGNVMLV
jgi:hypothetical protein